MAECELDRLTSELREERLAREIITYLATRSNVPGDATECNRIPEMLEYLGKTLVFQRITLVCLDGQRTQVLDEWSSPTPPSSQAAITELGRLSDQEIDALFQLPDRCLRLDGKSAREHVPAGLDGWFRLSGADTALLYFAPPREKACLVAFQNMGAPPFDDRRLALLRTVVEILLLHHRQTQADLELRESEQFLRMAQAAAGLTCWEVNVGKYRRTYGDCFGATDSRTQKIQVIPWDRAFEQYAPPFDEQIRAVVEDAWKNSEPFVLEAMRLDADGAERWVEVRARAKIGEGNDARIYGTTQDIDARKKIERKLRGVNAKLDDMARRDALTGLLNKREFVKDIRNLCTVFERIKRPLSLIMLDIDFFKAYNDHYGHLGGDECLRRVGEEIGACLLRDADSAYRYGGEEFAVILPDTNPEGAARVAEKIRGEIHKLGITHEYSGVSDVVTASIGFATTDANDGTTFKPNSLIARADAALYRAKKGGRNRVEG